MPRDRAYLHEGFAQQSRARTAFDAACDAGSEEACVELGHTWNPNGVTLFFGGRYGRPFGGQFSFSAIVGRKVDGQGGSHIIPAPPFVGGRGWLVQAELGPQASKLSVGWGQMAGCFSRRERKASVGLAPPVTVGWAFKASVVRATATNDVSNAGDVYVGVEVDYAIGVRLTGGVFQGVGDTRGTLVSWGVGMGF